MSARIYSFLLLMCLSAAAQEQIIYGIGSHLGQARTDPKTLLNWLKKSDFNGIRDEIYWGDVEPSPGVYQLSTRAKNTLSVVNQLAANGLKPLISLNYGNRFYDGGDQPYTSEGIAGFAQYSQHIAKITASNVDLFEVWNEWNIGAGTRPRRRTGSPEDYVKLVDATAKAVHQVKPGAQVIAGALADDLGNWPWLQSAIRYGLLNYADGISVHFYNYLNPLDKGGDAEFMLRLNQLESILRAAKPQNTPKIYITEMGWPNHQGRGGVPLDMASDSATRFLLSSKESALLAGVWFYELQDEGTDPGEKEHHFGVLNRDESEKPISCSIRRTKFFTNNLTLKSSEVKNNIKRQLYFSNSGKKLTAIWSTEWNKPNPIKISIKSASEFQILNLGCDTPLRTSVSQPIQKLLNNTPVLIEHFGELNISYQ